MSKALIYLKFFICGIAVSIPYVFPRFWILAYITLVPFVYMLIGHTESFNKRKAYLVGLCFGMGYFGVMFHWFTEFYPMEFASVTKGTAALLVATCWIGLALVQALEFGFVTLVYRLLNPKKEKPLICAFVITAIWVVFEWQQNLFWRGVPWARLAITQVEAPFALQSASLLGGQFVGGLIVMINTLLAIAARYAVEKLDKTGIKAITGALKNKKTAILASVAIGLFAINSLFGAVRLLTYDAETNKPIKAAAIQGNLSSLDKWSASPAKSLNVYLELTEKCVKETGAKLVVWPESVIPITLSAYPTFTDRIAECADELDITLLVGAFDRAKATEDEYNTMYLFSADGELSKERYHKRRLVPFGEYTPMEKLVLTVLPVLDTFNIFNDPLSPGENATVFKTGVGESEVGIGPLICFDSIYDYLSASTVKNGAEIITLSTNDSWFSDSPAVWQHNSHAVLRAIETDRYIVRAATTGVSTVISPTGEVIAQVEPLTEGYAVADIYARDTRTVYSYIGNVFVYICIGYLAFMASYKITEGIKNRK